MQRAPRELHSEPRLTPACSHRGQRERRLNFLSLRPVVIRVAFEAPRLRVFRSRRVASPARRNPRQKHVARFHARQRFFMAAHARKSPVRVVIEFRVRHPL